MDELIKYLASRIVKLRKSLNQDRDEITSDDKAFTLGLIQAYKDALTKAVELEENAE